MSSINHDDFVHLKIPLEILISATNNFDDENLVGKTGFGKYYAGQLLWSGGIIDILARRLNKEWFNGHQQFWMEISLLSSLDHKNLVSFVGFSDDNGEKVIIYRRESRRSLSNYLSPSMLLTWVQRLEISVGIAKALSYIHYDESRDFSVIHRNIDSHSVYLNNDWEPKLGDFIDSMKIKASERHNSFNTDKVWISTHGYTDPTYIETKSANRKSDVYSFGIVMFELLCGMEVVIDNDQDDMYLAPMAITRYKEKRLNDIIDWDLWQQMDSESFNTFVETAYDCLNEERSQRPNIDVIVPKLEKALKLAYENRPIMSLPIAHLKVPLENILSATNDLARKRYKGQLLWSEKRLSQIPEAMNNGKKEMVVNYNILSKEKHDTTEIKLSREDIKQHYGKTMKKAAEELGVSLSTLKRKHNKLGMSGWQGPVLPQRKAYNSSNNQSTESHTHEKDNGIIQDPSPVKRNDKTLIKAEYADDIIKLHLGISELTFVTVENEIGKKLKLKHGTFKIKYLDEDEEWILMTSDQDITDCMQNSRNVDRSVVRLRVLLHNQ